MNTKAVMINIPYDLQHCLECQADKQGVSFHSIDQLFPDNSIDAIRDAVSP